MSTRVGRPTSGYVSAIETFIKGKRINDKTKQKYRWMYTRFFRDLQNAGLNTDPDGPDRVGAPEINYLLDVSWKGLESSTREWYTKLMSMFLCRFGNNIVEEMDLLFPTDARVNVDWLEPMDMVDLLDASLTPLQTLVIHLELCVGLRRVECIRLRMDDVKSGYFEIRGKGRATGKWRTVPFHPDTPDVLALWYKERNRMIAEARIYRPAIHVPDALIIWKRFKQKPQIGEYSENGDGIDKQVMFKVRELTGMKFGNHTLRRTCGRAMWKSRELTGKPVPIETIAEIYGHANIKDTRKYIGVNYDDMSEAMGALHDYQKGLRKRGKKEELECEK